MCVCWERERETELSKEKSEKKRKEKKETVFSVLGYIENFQQFSVEVFFSIKSLTHTHQIINKSI